jgi:hemoglobin/transferrin/lactoferrin receptor protein
MKSILTSALALTMLLLIFPSAAAQTADDPKPQTPQQTSEDAKAEEAKTETPIPSFFSETTVTATGSKRDVFEVATPVTIVPKEKIERKAPQNAADLLREEPGVDVSGVGPNQMRPVIRAQRGLRVLFLENGLRLNNPRRQTDFGEISGLVDLGSVQTMEVVRGPASVLYGSDAIGGVLNLISRDPVTTPFAGALDLSWADAGDRRRSGAWVSGAMGAFSWQVGASKREADDYEAPSGDFGEIRLPHSTHVLDSGVDDDTLWGSLGWSINERNLLRFRMNRYDAGPTGFGYIPGEEYGVQEEAKVRILYPEQQFDRYTLSYFGNSDTNVLASSTNVQVYYQRNKRRLNNDIDINIGPIAPGFPDSLVEADTRNLTLLSTTGLRADAVKVFGGGAHVVTYGVEAYRDRSFNTDFSVTTTHLRFAGPPFEIVQVSTRDMANAPNATNTSSGLFAQDEYTVNPRLRITAGLRYHSVQTKATATPNWDVSDLDFKDSNTVGSLTATYELARYINAFVSYGTAFRAPNIIERLFNGPTPEGEGYQLLNPALTSETSGNWDVGVKYRRANAFMELVGFRNTISDGIIQDFLSPEEVLQLPAELQAAIRASGARFVVKQVNADRLRYEGLELAAGYRMPAGITVGGNFTRINATRLGSTTILPPDDIYRMKTFLYARYEPQGSRYWAEINARHNGSAKANVDPDEPPPPVGAELPAFTVANLGVGARVYASGPFTHDVSLWIDNLADTLYAEFNNASFFRPEPGRTVRVGYRLGF